MLLGIFVLRLARTLFLAGTRFLIEMVALEDPWLLWRKSCTNIRGSCLLKVRDGLRHNVENLIRHHESVSMHVKDQLTCTKNLADVGQTQHKRIQRNAKWAYATHLAKARWGTGLGREPTFLSVFEAYQGLEGNFGAP